MNINKHLKAGKLVSFATDTVYALACDANNSEAIEKIYQIKNRDRSKFLGILVSNVDCVEKICYISNREKSFLEENYDKGVTLILKKKIKFLKYIGDRQTISVRVAHNEYLKKLSENFNGLIAMTSLNLAGEKEIFSFQEAKKRFADQVDLIIDGGVCKFKNPSTIVKFIDGEMKILRKGVFPKISC